MATLQLQATCTISTNMFVSVKTIQQYTSKQAPDTWLPNITTEILITHQNYPIQIPTLLTDPEAK